MSLFNGDAGLRFSSKTIMGKIRIAKADVDSTGKKLNKNKVSY